MKNNIFNHKNSNTPSIKIVRTWEADATGQSEFFAPGAIIHVQNGKGLLREEYGYLDEKSYLTLMCGDMPLFEMQGDEYFCPTCEKIIRSGYADVGDALEFKWTKINKSATEVNFLEALEETFLLLGLMQSGYYVVIDTTLHPTDGNGHFFWDVPGSFGEQTYFKGTCLFQYDDYEWGNLRPYFMVATQTQGNCNMERVEYYRKNPGCRAIAYYMDGYMTALIDGHHKSYAAALEKQDINALVICPAQIYWTRTGQETELIPGLRAFDMRFTFEELGIDRAYADEKRQQMNVNKRLSTEEMQRRCNAIYKNNQKNKFFENVNELAKAYPDAVEQAYIDRVGLITDELLDNIKNKKIYYTPKEVEHLMIALGALHHERLFEMGDFFLHEGEGPGTTKWVIVEELMKCERNDELEQYLLEIMVELEDEYPAIKDLVLGYF